VHEPPHRDGERDLLGAAAGGLEVVFLPHGAAAVVVRVEVWCGRRSDAAGGLLRAAARGIRCH
jgi:hypothetical protein